MDQVEIGNVWAAPAAGHVDWAEPVGASAPDPEYDPVAVLRTAVG